MIILIERIFSIRILIILEPRFQIIYLNGPSCSGKTTLGHALQKVLQDPFLYIGVDTLIDMMPAKLNDWEGGNASSKQGLSWKESYDKEGHLLSEIQIGPYAKKMMALFKEIVVTAAKQGFFIIVDDVAFGKSEVNQWKTALNAFRVLWVSLKAPVSILETREKNRTGRKKGAARAQSGKVHEGVSYDLDFDSNLQSQQEMALAIQKRIYD